MSEIRDAILERMEKLNLTTYQLWKLVEGKVPQRTVYSFISGEKDAGTETASIIMSAIGLKVKIAKSIKRGQSPRK